MIRSRALKAGSAVPAALATLAFAGCGGGGDGDGDGGQASKLPDGCMEVAAPEPKRGVSAQPPKQELRGPASALVTTSCGVFTIELDTSRSPKTASSFASLAKQGFYDDTSIHRIARDFVVQGGDPIGDGTGGPGYSVDEPPPDGLTYTTGTVAMAKTAAEPPGRSGSQFFVVTAPADAGLPSDYALLGRVSEGFEVVERIEMLGDPTGADGPPTAPVVIETIMIEAG